MQNTKITTQWLKHLGFLALATSSELFSDTEQAYGTFTQSNSIYECLCSISTLKAAVAALDTDAIKYKAQTLHQNSEDSICKRQPCKGVTAGRANVRAKN